MFASPRTFGPNRLAVTGKGWIRGRSCAHVRLVDFKSWHPRTGHPGSGPSGSTLCRDERGPWCGRRRRAWFATERDPFPRHIIRPDLARPGPGRRCSGPIRLAVSVTKSGP